MDPKNMVRQVFDFQIKEVGPSQDRVLEFIGSTSDVDRYGDIIDVEGWDLKNYLKNPVFLWAHNYQHPPIGKALSVKKADGALTFRIQFPTPEEFPFADTIYKLYLGGYLKATSVGFGGLDSEGIYGEPQGDSGWRPYLGTHYHKQELYELSAVPVPANPNALQMAVKKGILSAEQVKTFPSQSSFVGPLCAGCGKPWEEKECGPHHAKIFAEIQAGTTGISDEAKPEEKGVIPYKAYPKEDEDAAWDGPAQVKAADVVTLKLICTWFDSEKPDIKGSYKLPHHLAENKHVVWKGVSAAMAALLGARGGVDVPDGDRKGIYNHLAKHYKQFDKDVPEFKDYTAVELRLIEPEEIDKLLEAKPMYPLGLAPIEAASRAIIQMAFKQAAGADACASCPEQEGCCCTTCANNQAGVCCCDSCDKKGTCECCPGEGACDTCLCKVSGAVTCDGCDLSETCVCNSCDQAPSCHCGPCSPTTPPQRAAGNLKTACPEKCVKCPFTNTCSCKGCDLMDACHCSPCTPNPQKSACGICKGGNYQAKAGGTCPGKVGKLPVKTKTGAVLSAKNKEHLEKCVGHMKDAMDRCQKVLDAATPADDDDSKSYYRVALNPGEEPHGVKPADATKEAVEMEKIRQLTEKLHSTLFKK